MTSDRLDRIDLLLYRAKYEITSPVDNLLIDILDLVSEELRYLHNRPLTQQVLDSGQELLKEQN